MRDPFASKSNSSALRDAQLGLLLVATLLGLFVYVIYYRVTGQGRVLPEHVRMAPVATTVWPNGPAQPQTYETLTDIAPNTTAPTVAVAAQSNQRQATNPARSVEPIKKPIRKPLTSTIVSPEPVRTDRNVAPVDFQRAASKEKPKSAPFKIMPPKKMVAKPAIEPAPSPTPIAPKKIDSGAFVNKMTKPQTQPAKPAPSSNAFQPTKQPTKSIFEQNTDTVQSADVNHLRPVSTKPRMLSPSPTPQVKKPNAENSFQPLANSFQPSPNTFQPTTEQTDFSPQEDIAKSARALTVAASELESIASKTKAEQKPVFQSPASDTATLSPATDTAKQTQNVYVTQPDDSFWSIATEKYGDGRLFDALYRWNQTKVTGFDDLPTATKLEIPTKTELARRWPDLCPNDKAASQATAFNAQTVANYDSTLTERLYTTREGDTLFEIAAKKLGQASRYVDIMAKNDQRLPADVNQSVPLQAGLRLVLPD